MVASQEVQAPGAATDVTDWLIKPFTGAYARTKIRAWVLRTACQWMREGYPEDEERRLARLPMHVQHRRAGPRARGSRPLPQKETEKKRFPENVISTDKSVLLWMIVERSRRLKLRPLARRSASLSLAQPAPPPRGCDVLFDHLVGAGEQRRH